MFGLDIFENPFFGKNILFADIHLRNIVGGVALDVGITCAVVNNVFVFMNFGTWYHSDIQNFFALDVQNFGINADNRIEHRRIGGNVDKILNCLRYCIFRDS